MLKLARPVIMLLAVKAVGCDDDDDQTRNIPPTTIPPATGSTSERVVARNDIASDQRGALARDPLLVNAWGLAFNSAGPAWVSATESGVSLVYDANGEHLIPPVTIPPAGDAEQSKPTGQVFNGDPASFMGDVFVFVSEDGGISGWQPSDRSEATLRVDNSADRAIYKGVAIAQPASGTARLYAADFHNAKIDVFDAEYDPLEITGDFSDPDLPRGYAPFNVEVVEDMLIVTYAQQDDDAEDDVKGAGRGFVNLFDLEGVMLSRLISRGELNAPWGVTLTPSTFAAAPERLLVGNFGDGMINVYQVDFTSPTSPAINFEGALRDSSGDVISIDGLWALEFATSTASGFAMDQLYFTAGPDDEEHGVFGGLETTTLSAGAGAGGTGGTGGTGGAPVTGGTGGSGPPVGY